MSVQAMSWVLDHSESTLGARLVLLSIANHARADGSGAWPSINQIGIEARLSEREVRYCLRTLEESGELVTELNKGPCGTNLYTIPQVGQTLPPAIYDIKGGNLQHLGGQPIAPEPSLTVPKPSLEESAKSVCSKCGEVGIHKCGGWKSTKAREREFRRINRRPVNPEVERLPRYINPSPPTVTASLDEDFPRLRPPK